jgi:hydrogenase maturation protease
VRFPEAGPRRPFAILFPENPVMRAVILGIGNTLLSDEGIGVHALNALLAQYHLPDTVTPIDGGTASMELLEDLANLDLLLVLDTIVAGQPPGGLIRLADEDVPMFFRKKLSPHQISLADVLASLEFLGQLPKRVVVLGIQPQSLELGLALTPVVAARLPELVDMALRELAANGLHASPLGEPVLGEALPT